MGDVLRINIEKEKLGLSNRVPLSLSRRKKGARRLTPSALALAGKIYSFSHTSDSEAVCRLTYEQVQKEFGCARSTAAAAFGQLRDEKRIARIDRDQGGTAYKYIDAVRGKQFDIIPQYLYTADVCISGEWRRFTLSEIRVLARLMTECAYAKNGGSPRYGGGVYNASNKQIARLLNLSETTVKKSLHALMKARLVFRKAENKGVNRHKLSGYEVNRKLYEYKPIKQKRVKVKNPVQEAVKAANYKAERESYYAKLREAAQARVDKYMAIAKGNARFAYVNTRLSSIEVDIAKAEVYAPVSVAQLEEEKRLLNVEKARLLRSMGLKVADLEMRHTCIRCSDTGFLPNGKACDCYPERLQT